MKTKIVPKSRYIMFPTDLQVRNIDVLFSLSQGKYISLVNSMRIRMTKMEKIQVLNHSNRIPEG